jgi:hypothetical protein
MSSDLKLPALRNSDRADASDVAFTGSACHSTCLPLLSRMERDRRRAGRQFVNHLLRALFRWAMGSA